MNTNKQPMRNLLLSAAIGDIAGMPYEFDGRTKIYDKVDLLHPDNDYTDDTVCTFACAEALLHKADMAQTLWSRGRADFNRGFGGRYAQWLLAPTLQPAYGSFGNGSAMRCSAAGFMAKTKEECIDLATQTALPTHNHPEGIKGAVTTALAIHYAMNGEHYALHGEHNTKPGEHNVDPGKHYMPHTETKSFIRKHVLDEYYPDWSTKTYEAIKPAYRFDETCQQTVPAALICFLESTDYADCLKLSIALGGDADTLAAIAAPIAYAFYREIPEPLIENAKNKLPQWMLDINDEFDDYCNG